MSLTIEQTIQQHMRGHNLGKKYTITNPGAKFLILKLLRQRPADLRTISIYINKPAPSTKQFITLLRRDGYYITLQGKGGLYELRLIDCLVCGKSFELTSSVRRHHTRCHK